MRAAIELAAAVSRLRALPAECQMNVDGLRPPRETREGRFTG